MAVAGSGGWKPAQLFCIVNGELIPKGVPQNVPRTHVQMDMSAAADSLRQGSIVRVHYVGDNIVRLRQYLVNSGHVMKPRSE